MMDTSALGFPDRRKPIRTHRSCVKHIKYEPRVRPNPGLKGCVWRLCPMSPGLGAGPRSAHVMRMVIATAGAATLVVGRAGVAMAVGPPLGASASTPVGKAAVSVAPAPSGANVSANGTGAGPTHGSVPVNVGVNTQHPSVTVNSQKPS